MNGLLESLLSCIHSLVEKGAKDLQGFFEEDAIPSEESLNQLVDAMAVVCSVYTMFFKKAILQGRRNIGSFFRRCIMRRGRIDRSFACWIRFFFPISWWSWRRSSRSFPCRVSWLAQKTTAILPCAA